jgi:hypothetical protein
MKQIKCTEDAAKVLKGLSFKNKNSFTNDSDADWCQCPLVIPSLSNTENYGNDIYVGTIRVTDSAFEYLINGELPYLSEDDEFILCTNKEIKKANALLYQED